MRICDKCIHDKVCLLSKSRANCELFDEKRPHGEWKQVGEMTYKCTKCGWIKKTCLMPYCPNCGADMREGDMDG